SNDEMLNFVRALVDTCHPQVTVPTFDRHLPCVTHTTMNLHHTIYHTIGHVRTIKLGHAGLVPVIQPLVGFPGGMKCQPLSSLNFHRGIGKHPLDSLAISDGLTKGDSLF